MTRQLIIRPEAEADIAQAFDWYEARVAGLGSEFLLVLDAALSSILRNPSSLWYIKTSTVRLREDFRLPFFSLFRKVG